MRGTPEMVRRSWAGLRRHWLLAVVLVVATGLRVVVQFAYRPALIFPDSERYLEFTNNFLTGHWYPDWIRTSGYSLLTIPAVAVHNLALIPLAQHLLGLVSAVLIYAAGVRFGAWRPAAVLATIPVLFDPLQLDIEQYVLTDTSATFLLLAALVVLVWKRDRIGLVAPAAAGLLLAGATVIRQSDLVLVGPAVIYLLLTVRPWRRLAVRVGLLLGAFLIPVLGYLGWYYAWHGQFEFVDYSGDFMYGRVVQFADCSGLNLPPVERPLCPKLPPAQRNLDWYMWAVQSPQWTLNVPKGMSRNTITRDFSVSVAEHQPLAYLSAVGRDVAYSFSPVRGDGPEHYPIWYHQFHTFYPLYQGATATLRDYGDAGPHVQPALAGFLQDYGRDFYTPGPLLAAGLLLGAVGMAGVGRARRSGLRAACLLFTLGALAAVVPPLFVATFDWRYQLPQLSLIPVAAVLGVTALTSSKNRSPNLTAATVATSADPAARGGAEPAPRS